MTTQADLATCVVDVAMSHPMASELIREQVAELASRYGDADASPIEVEQFASPRGAFFVVIHRDQPVGCAGIRVLSESAAMSWYPAVELKRMYVRPEFRGHGFAALLMDVAQARAVALGASHLLLETGDLQPEAIALYQKLGYKSAPGFGYYAKYDGSRPMVKRLEPAKHRR